MNMHSKLPESTEAGVYPLRPTTAAVHNAEAPARRGWLRPAIIAAVLAIRVVRSLTARLEERFRRIRHSTAESLAAQQIVIEDRVL